MYVAVKSVINIESFALEAQPCFDAQCLIFLSDLKQTEFPDRFSSNCPVSNSMHIRHTGALLMHAERQADRQTGRYDEANWPFLPFMRKPINFTRF
jgi:hypothetical protein